MFSICIKKDKQLKMEKMIPEKANDFILNIN